MLVVHLFVGLLVFLLLFVFLFVFLLLIFLLLLTFDICQVQFLLWWSTFAPNSYLLENWSNKKRLLVWKILAPKKLWWLSVCLLDITPQLYFHYQPTIMKLVSTFLLDNLSWWKAALAFSFTWSWKRVFFSTSNSCCRNFWSCTTWTLWAPCRCYG